MGLGTQSQEIQAFWLFPQQRLLQRQQEAYQIMDLTNLQFRHFMTLHLTLST